MKIPPVGESITEVTVGTWYKKEGDHVKMDDVLCGLDSDKATFELTAEADGVLHILAQEGDVLPIGASICTIDDEGGTPGHAPAAEPARTEAPKAEAAPGSSGSAVCTCHAGRCGTSSGSCCRRQSSIIEMKVPAVGESVTEVTIASWSKKDGDQVALDEVLCELESDKATFELPAEAAGTLRIVAQAGETLPIGALIAKLKLGLLLRRIRQSAPQPSASAPETAASGQNGNSYAAHYPSPAAAKILDEKGVNAQQVQGTGVGGRITKEDAMKASPAPLSQHSHISAKASCSGKPAAAPAESSCIAGSRNQRREKMTSLRRTIARRLVAVKNETAMLTTFNEVDMKPIMDLRNKFKDKFKEKNGVGLGFMSFFTKAVCIALKDFPAVNAQIDGDQMVSTISVIFQLPFRRIGVW